MHVKEPSVSIASRPQLHEIEARLDAIAEGYRQASLPKAALEAKDIIQLKQEHLLLSEICNDFHQQLAALEKPGDHETSQLHKNFEPLLQRLHLYEEAIKISAVFTQLQQRIQNEIHEVLEATLALAKQFLPNHLPRFESGLEQFQDRCDAVADQLDALESQSHDIQPLVILYEKWLAHVETFTEVLDERSEALNPRYH